MLDLGSKKSPTYSKNWGNFIKNAIFSFHFLNSSKNLAEFYDSLLFIRSEYPDIRIKYTIIQFKSYSSYGIGSNFPSNFNIVIKVSKTSVSFRAQTN